MAEESAAESFGKAVLGGAVGFALYILVTGLGLGGRGEGRGEGGRGRGEPLAEPPSVPSPPPPPRPKDEKRLTLVMMQPTASGPESPMSFRLKDDDPSTKTYSLEEAIARIRSGGRSDVNLRIRGSVRAGSADAALELLRRAGIQVWKEETPPPPHVSGNARGQYGRGHR